MKKFIGIAGKVLKIAWTVWSVFATITLFPIVIAWSMMYLDTGRGKDELVHYYHKGWASFWDNLTGSNLSGKYGVKDDDYTKPITESEDKNKDHFRFGFH